GAARRGAARQGTAGRLRGTAVRRRGGSAARRLGEHGAAQRARRGSADAQAGTTSGQLTMIDEINCTH
ncbi:hypothetical protein PSH03_001136, partial [Micromonospora sp. PSH03]|uniref:hypothetical protein n=1 Tax=Micromonospora salmantinae TaxID=2911211 RepID=UPI001EE7928F